VSTVRWQRDVPESIRSLGALEDTDYEDVVTSTMQEMPEMTPEQLVRATLKGLPRSLVLVVPAIQRMVLGLRLELRPSPDHVLGWKIAERAENWIRIEAASWFLTGHVVMHAEEDCLSFATFVRYDRRPAALVWPPVSLIHRQVALALVRSATKIR
jgi:hypothetical protein